MPLVNRLEALQLGKKGSSLFVNMLPAEARHGVLVRSPLNGTPINYELPGYYQAKFTVIVRTPAAEYEKGMALMKEVTFALTASNLQVEDQFFNYVRPRTQPVVFPLSAGNLLEISAQFDANYVEQV
ncbi:minor capsid protein [Massilia sp. TN1-12]|uniref:minor capsid protein n=1 Tax=Massilia paldalensis TaxID=3377675 RepID=UPI00384A802A